MQKQLLIFLLALTTGCAQRNQTNQATEPVTTDSIPVPDTITKATFKIPEAWKQKAAAGIDFIATGNEPFWSIEIDDEKFIRYSTPEGIQLTTPPVKAVLVDADTKLYSAETEKGTMELQIMKKICVNDMSGDSSAYTVHLTIKLKKDEKPNLLHGCGTSLKPE
jgi:uncharacterized membrane protein